MRPAWVVTLADDLAAEGEEYQGHVIVHEFLRLRDRGNQFTAMMTAFVPDGSNRSGVAGAQRNNRRSGEVKVHNYGRRAHPEHR